MRSLMLSAALGAALWSPVSHAAEDDFEFELEGYYRVRGYAFPGLYENQSHSGNYMMHRLRMQPQLNFQDRAKFFMMADMFDNVVWGDNSSASSTALFAEDPTNVGLDGQPVDPIQVKRAWMEFSVPVGLFRVGRQASHWGMGLLANDGNGMAETFGEKNGGATFDRVMFATRPIAVAQGLTGKDDSGIPFFVAVAVDRLVEDPLIQHYGYQCDPADPDDDPRCAPDDDHGYTDDTYSSSDRPSSWWVDADDDVIEMVYAAIYRGEDKTFGRHKGDLTVGGYLIHRYQQETASQVLIWDLYVRALIGKMYVESEALTIQGKSSAIALPGAVDPATQASDPLYKEPNIAGYVARVGYVTDLVSLVAETGYASGDDDVADENFTGRSLNSDYNVGLLLYEEILARVSSTTWTADAAGLWSDGGVTNSRYLFPHVKWRPLDHWEIIGAYLVAFPHKPDGARIACAPSDDVECATYDATASTLGWEADLAIKHTFHNHINLSVEGGYASITDRVPLANVGLDPDGKFVTVQSRVAYEF